MNDGFYDWDGKIDNASGYRPTYDESLKSTNKLHACLYKGLLSWNRPTN